jgi:hypothetical protein
LHPNYAQYKEFQGLERVYSKQYRLEKSGLVSKAQQESRATSPQSADDWEATIREMGCGNAELYRRKLVIECLIETVYRYQFRNSPIAYVTKAGKKLT